MRLSQVNSMQLRLPRESGALGDTAILVAEDWLALRIW